MTATAEFAILDRSAFGTAHEPWQLPRAATVHEFARRPHSHRRARAAVSVGGGREPVWSPSGDEIVYRSIDGEHMMAVSVRTEPSLTIGQPRTLFQGHFRLGAFWSKYDVSPKTKDFLMVAVDEPTRPEARSGDELSAGSRTVAGIGEIIARTI